MFDELHDPDPPTGDTTSFAAVAERAAGMRRKRRATVALFAALAIVAGGAVALSISSRGDDGTLVAGPGPDSATPAVIAESPAPSGPSTSIVDRVDESVLPQPTAPSSAIEAVESNLPHCVFRINTPARCPSFGRLAAGNLVSLSAERAADAGPTLTVYDTSSTRATVELQLDADRVAAWLLAVGPGDIGYVSWIPVEVDTTLESGATTDASVSAFELTGENAGRLVADFDTTVSRAGGDDFVDYTPTATGLVAVGCCDRGATRPIPAVQPVIGWVDATGAPILGTGSYFSVGLADGVSITVDRPGVADDRNWQLPELGVDLRGMPPLFELADGTVVVIVSELRSPESIHYSLRPNGAIEEGPQVDRPIRHVLADGRFLVQNLDGRTFAIIHPTTPPVKVAEVIVPDVEFFDGLVVCSSLRSCTYDNLGDGRLVQIDADGTFDRPEGEQTDNQPVARLYSADADEVETIELDGFLPPFSTFLLAVGPGDIAYLLVPGPDDGGRIVAYSLIGASAGNRLREWELPEDPVAGGTPELVATADGLVAVGCCGPLRPEPDADVLVPWIDDSGNAVTSAGPTFTAEFADNITITRTGGGIERPATWTIDELVAPGGMLRLFPLDDGGAVLIDDGNGDGPTPVFLRPDGSTVRGIGQGFVRHVLPDGRFVREDEAIADIAALPGVGRPLTAITTSGDAVYFPRVGGDAILIYDGPDIADAGGIGDGPNAVDRVAYSDAEDRFVVSRCCSPIVGHIVSWPADRLPMPTDISPPIDEVGDSELDFGGFGYAPALNPTGSKQVTIIGDGVTVVDAADDLFRSVVLPPESGDAQDVLWVDDDQIVVLGMRENAWTITIISDVGGEMAIDVARPFATIGSLEHLRFAGNAIDGEIAVHDVGTDMVLTGTIDDYGNSGGDESGSSLRVIDLPAPAKSAWFTSPTELIWVDADGTLRIGADIVPGDYVWARR